MMARGANVYMKVKHGKERKLVYLGAYVATRTKHLVSFLLTNESEYTILGLGIQG